MPTSRSLVGGLCPFDRPSPPASAGWTGLAIRTARSTARVALFSHMLVVVEQVVAVKSWLVGWFRLELQKLGAPIPGSAVHGATRHHPGPPSVQRREQQKVHQSREEFIEQLNSHALYLTTLGAADKRFARQTGGSACTSTHTRLLGQYCPRARVSWTDMAGQDGRVCLH